MGYVSFRSEAYVSLGTVETRSHFSLVRTHGHHDSDHLRHHARMVTHSIRHQYAILRLLAPLLRFIVLWSRHYDFTVLTTHILPYLSLTLRDLSLDSHSFHYSSLSRLCSFLLSLLHFLCNPSIFIFGIILCQGHSSIYSVVTAQCSSLALIS